MAQSVFDLFTPVATWIGGSQHCFEAGITPGDVGKELPCWWVSSLEVLFLALCRAFLSEPVKRVFTFEHIGSSTMCRLPGFYQQVLAAWLLTGNRDHLENLTSKITYRCIQPAVTHRCVTKFADYHLDWPALWPDLDFFFVDKPIWKSNVLILHGILPHRGQIGSLGDRASEPALSLWAARDSRAPPGTLPTNPDPCWLVQGVVGMQMAWLSPLERTHPVWSSSLHWVSGRIQVYPGNFAPLRLGC